MLILMEGLDYWVTLKEGTKLWDRVLMVATVLVRFSCQSHEIQSRGDLTGQGVRGIGS